jgi:hypothetical protein
MLAVCAFIGAHDVVSHAAEPESPAHVYPVLWAPLARLRGLLRCDVAWVRTRGEWTSRFDAGRSGAAEGRLCECSARRRSNQERRECE